MDIADLGLTYSLLSLAIADWLQLNSEGLEQHLFEMESRILYCEGENVGNFKNVANYFTFQILLISGKIEEEYVI